MPVQDLARWDRSSRVWPDKAHTVARRRRTGVFTATLALTAAASHEMYQVLNVRGMTGLQIALLVAFTINFVWIALPFVHGLVGFLVLWGRRGVSGITMPALQQTPSLTTRTALLMPIYNEAPQVFLQDFRRCMSRLTSLGSWTISISSFSVTPRNQTSGLRKKSAFGSYVSAPRGRGASSTGTGAKTSDAKRGISPIFANAGVPAMSIWWCWMRTV